MLTRPSSKKLDILSGIARGIIADKVVNRKEELFFKRWIRKNAPRNKTWPWVELLRIAQQKKKGDTKKELLALFKKLSGLKKLSFKTELLSTGLAFPKRQATITFKNKSFCFTGVFKEGGRAKMRQAIASRGGVFHKKLSKKKTDYLVVGTYASPSWLSAHFGRKLEVAKATRARMRSIKVVSETNLLKKLGRGW